MDPLKSKSPVTNANATIEFLIFLAERRPKSKSQRMKEYRERKKALLGDKWLSKERQRVKQYYKPKPTERPNRTGRKQTRGQVRRRKCGRKRMFPQSKD